MIGPPNTVYSSCIFTIIMYFDASYPIRPPRLYLKENIIHLNIHTEYNKHEKGYKLFIKEIIDCNRKKKKNRPGRYSPHHTLLLYYLLFLIYYVIHILKVTIIVGGLV